MKDIRYNQLIQLRDLAWAHGTKSWEVKDFINNHREDQKFVELAETSLRLMELLRPGITGPKRWYQFWRA